MAARREMEEDSVTADVIEGVVVEVGQGDALVNQATEGLVLEIVQAMCDVVDGHKTIAEGMAQLLDDHQWTQRKIAAEIGCSQATVSRHLEWLALGDGRPLYGDRIKAIKAAPEPKVAPKVVEVEVDVEPVIEGVIVPFEPRSTSPSPSSTGRSHTRQTSASSPSWQPHCRRSMPLTPRSARTLTSSRGVRSKRARPSSNSRRRPARSSGGSTPCDHPALDQPRPRPERNPHRVLRMRLDPAGHQPAGSAFRCP